MYTRTVSKTVEVPAEPEVSRPVEGPQQAEISDTPQAEEKKGLVGQILEKIVNALPSTTAYAEGIPDGSGENPVEGPELPECHAPDCPMNPDNIIEMEQKCPRCLRDRGLDYINAPGTYPYRLEHRYGANCQHNHGEIYCNCGGHYGYKRASEVTPETSCARIVTVIEQENYRATQKPLPPGLPRPICPQEPNWFEIGWEFLRGRSIDDMIWARWFPPMAKDYAGILHPCSGFADLGEVNDAELDRLDEEIRKEFEETRQSAADFGKGIVVGLLRNAGELPFNIAGAILNSSEIQDMPDNMEAPGIENKTAYQCGKITADALTTALGIAEVILGVGEIATGIAGDVGGGALCATVVGAPVGVAAIAGSTVLVVSGAAEVGAGITLAVSGGKNLGDDIGEFNKPGSDRNEKISEPTSQNQMQKQVEKGQAPKDVDRVDKPHVDGQQPHVHFKDGTSLNQDGTVHDKHLGIPKLTKKTRDWLINNGWKVND